MEEITIIRMEDTPMNFIKKNGPGLLLCLIIAVPSWFLGQAVPVIGGPVFAILTGMVITLILRKKDAFTPGINYTSKKILQAAVVFLGFGMNLTEIPPHHTFHHLHFPDHSLYSVQGAQAPYK